MELGERSMEVGAVGLPGPAVAETARGPTPDPVTVQLQPMEDQTVLESVDTPTPALEIVVLQVVRTFL